MPALTTGSGALLLCLLLVACGTSGEEYERRLLAACQDNQARAYKAALKAAVADGRSKAEALANMKTYIREVRETPACFAASVRDEVEQAAEAAARDELVQLEHPKFGA